MNVVSFSAVRAGKILFLASCFVSAMVTADAQEKVTAGIDSLMREHKSFSGVILYADFGKVQYHKAFGYRNFSSQQVLDRRDIFELASISKTFTAMAVMMLENDGKLSFDDPVSKYLSIPYSGITIRHLLNHTSGLPDYQAVMDQHWDKSQVAGNPEIIEYLNRYAPPALFKPGEKYEYSNTGYVLLASIVEKASGQDFIDYCTRHIFKPLHMKRTRIRTNAQKAGMKHFALGHIWVEEKQRFVRADSFPSSDYTIWLGNRKGPGRVSATAGNLLKWDKALYGNKLLPQQKIRQAFQPAKLNNDSLSNYGLGWMLKGLPVLGITTWHSGDNPGYRTRLMRYTGQRKTLIVLNNNAYPGFEEMMDALEAILPRG